MFVGSDGEKEENLTKENNMDVDSAPEKGIHELTGTKPTNFVSELLCSLFDTQ